MGIFDSIKNALGKSDSEPEADVTVAPSQMLRNAGLDSSSLKFGFGANSITVSGEISDESDRQKILDVLSDAPGISTIQDDMTVAAPTAVEKPADPEAADPEAAPAEDGARAYTVKSGDTLWKIAEQMYGNGSQYMKIFEANSGTLENPDQIFPGQELKIPKLGD